MAIFLILTPCIVAVERGEVNGGGEMAGGGGGKGLGVSNIYRPHWRRKNGDEGIRAKLMVIFYSGSVRSVLSNTVITSLVRGERERGEGERQ